MSKKACIKGAKEPKTCLVCKTIFTRWYKLGRTKYFCSNTCYFSYNKRENHASFTGGRWQDADGYVYISTGDGKHKSEHVLIAENVLGRPLKKNEVVHHFDGNKSNNTHSNLLICT